ncbi:NAD(P)-binding protein [Rhizodiscina lignyota]|uniref:NAD(P)-binding protein n=1 Tax=Rhizodiscina lignyota TaxID=1504668 RepID=A0A9P4IH81_9PEZI|nr:NAD(P)-binding protein [Rhizodiscina lignyota]
MASKGELVLITGGSGMIGFRVVVEALLAGYSVRAAVRSDAKAKSISSTKTIQEINPGSRLEFVHIPDIVADGAYDEAVKGVSGIIHVASPLFAGHSADLYEEMLIKPAIKATTNILDAAKKERSVKRVVITSSLFGTIPWSAFSDPEPHEKVYSVEPTPNPTARPFKDEVEAYAASKAYALNATNDWIADSHPYFDINNIMPAFVIGKNELETASKGYYSSGTNPLVMGILVGADNPRPLTGTLVHLWDVAQAHVRALDPSIAGGQSFALNTGGLKGSDYNDAKEVVKRDYPEAVEKGMLKPTGKMITRPLKYDASKTEEVLGFKFRSFDDLVHSMVDGYLELLTKELGLS